MSSGEVLGKCSCENHHDNTTNNNNLLTSKSSHPNIFAHDNITRNNNGPGFKFVWKSQEPKKNQEPAKHEQQQTTTFNNAAVPTTAPNNQETNVQQQIARGGQQVTPTNQRVSPNAGHQTTDSRSDRVTRYIPDELKPKPQGHAGLPAPGADSAFLQGSTTTNYPTISTGSTFASNQEVLSSSGGHRMAGSHGLTGSEPQPRPEVTPAGGGAGIQRKERVAGTGQQLSHVMTMPFPAAPPAAKRDDDESSLVLVGAGKPRPIIINSLTQWALPKEVCTTNSCQQTVLCSCLTEQTSLFSTLSGVGKHVCCASCCLCCYIYLP